jgi:cytochrome P450
MSLIEDVVRLAGQSVGDEIRFARRAVGLIQDRLQTHPQELFKLLRVVRPVYLHDGFAYVTRFHDVIEVLSRDREFTVDGYAPPMREITGDFILGMNQGPLYEHHISLLRLAFRQSDVRAIADLAAATAKQLVDAALPTGQIDIVKDLCDRVPARMAELFLGTSGPNDDTLVRWARAMFAEIFANPKRDPAITRESLAAAAGIRPHLDTLIATRRAELAAGVPAEETVLDRLLAQRSLGPQALSDVEIRTNLIGLLVGMIPTTSKASALAIDELLRRPRELAAIRAAERVGDDDLAARYVSEAMRLAPQAPGLIRRAAVDYPLARGTHHETTIPAGTLVFAATQSAMLDDAVVDAPEQFRIDRPDSVYLHYGTGLHSCFGRFVNRLTIPAIVRAALSIQGVERAPGSAGQLTIEGNYPTSMVLIFPAY